MESNGRIGTVGLGESNSHHSRSNASGAVGIYGFGRKGVPRARYPRSTYARRHAKTIGLVVLVAAVAIASVGALLPLSKGGVAESQEQQDRVLARAPQFSYTIQGYCWNTVNGTPFLLCPVTIVNKNTGEWETVLTDGEFGYFTTDISNNNPSFPTGYAEGDVINVTAISGTYAGWADERLVNTEICAYQWMDIILTDLGYVIPEFPMVIVPVLGMAALVAVVSVKRRSGKL